MDFILKSSFTPSGDQPKAITSLVSGIESGHSGQVLLGATGTGKTFTMANVIQQTQRPALIMCHNKTLAAQLCSEFQEFFPHNAVCYFVSYYDYYQPEAYVAASDTYIEKETSINAEIEKYRHKATQSLMTRRDTIIIASVSAIYGLGDSQSYLEMALELVQGKQYSRDVILRRLVDLQYKRANLEFKQGMFHVMGDTLEIFPPSGDSAYRLDFFGDDLERIEEIDGLTGEIFTEHTSISIFPASHNVTTKERIEQAIPRIEKDMNERYEFFMKHSMLLQAERIKTRTLYDIEMMRETGYTTGIENYVRYLSNIQEGEAPPTLMDYFPKDFLMFVDESHITIPQIRGMYNGNLARKKNLIDHGFRLPSAYDNRPLMYNEFEKYMKHTVFVSATPQEYEYTYSKNKKIEQIIRPTGLIDPEIEIRDSSTQVHDSYAEILKRVQNNERVLITTTTKSLAEKLASFLIEHNVHAQYLHSEIDTFERIEILKKLRYGSSRGGIDVVVGINLLREGLDLPEVSLVAVFDADKEGFLRSKDSLIQIVGRAARNVHGKVLMYSRKKEDGTLVITKAMKACIEETDRRRAIQISYNTEHNITPQSIVKDIHALETEAAVQIKQQTQGIPHEEKTRMIREITEKMLIAAEALDFEQAALLKKQIEILESE